jgi:MFS transporter, DHA1 family, multidrug resistance protein
VALAPEAKSAKLGLTVIIAGLSMLGPFSIDTYLPALPTIGASLGATPLQMQQTLTAYLIMFAVMVLWHGAISDALGRRRVILACLALYALASLFCAFAIRIEMLWLGRALQGMVGGAGMVIGRAIVRDLYDGAVAQRLMANATLVFAIAPAIAPVIGGAILASFDWHVIFFFLALVAIALFAACWRFLPETLPSAKRQKLSPGNLWRGYRDVFSSLEFLRLSLALAACFGGFFIYVMSSPVFLIEHLKLSPQEFAWLFIPIVLGMMLGSAINGRTAGRLTPRRTIALGCAIMVVATVGNISLNAFMAPRLPWPLVPLFCYVTGMALTMPCLQLLAMDLFPQRHGMASSCQSFLQSTLYAVVAGVVAPLLWGSTLTLALGMGGFLSVGLLAFVFSRAGRAPR